MIKLRYGNTNTFFLPGVRGGLLIDTDMAGTLPLFFKAIKAASMELGDIAFVMATHYHPDHMGLIGEMQKLGVKLLLMDVQRDAVHFSDAIFLRDRHVHYQPIDEGAAEVISCGDSRAFLAGMGICGEIISTPSHSADSVSVILDDGTCLTGDLEPLDFLPAYAENPALKRDWERILGFHPRRILYAHVNEKLLQEDASPTDKIFDRI